MFQISKIEPPYFIKAKKRVKKPKEKGAWGEDVIQKIKFKLREDMLKREQSMLCVYCEKKISADRKESNIDHFKTRNHFPEETLNYNNLLVSCNNEYHCSKTKDRGDLMRDDFKKLIHPVLENPAYFFQYRFTGEILPADGLNPQEYHRAKFTIEVFRLNKRSLQESRKRVALMIENYCKYGYSVDDFLSISEDYSSFVCSIFQQLSAGE